MKVENLITQTLQSSLILSLENKAYTFIPVDIDMYKLKLAYLSKQGNVSI